MQETNINKQFTADRYITEMGFRDSIFSLGTFARGTAIIQTSDKYKVTHKHKDNQGRLTIIRIENSNNKYTLVNIYAPTQNTEKPAFFDNLNDILNTTYQHDKLIIGGDFNYTHDELDRVNTLNKNKQSSHWLDNTFTTFSLVDAYRKIYPLGQDTTFAYNAHPVKSRLDRVYVPDGDTVARVSHLGETLEYTDHKAVLVSVTTAAWSRHRHTGSPHWKFNNSLLKSEFYTKTIQTLIENTIDISAVDQQTDMGETWTVLKHSIKHLTQIISKYINTQLRETEQHLKQQLDTLPEDTLEAHTIKAQLTEIQEHKYMGAQTRCRTRGMLEGPNKVFLTLEQNTQRRRIIARIQDSLGTIHTGNVAIANTFKEHFIHIYSKEHTDDREQDDILTYCKHLPDEDKSLLETPITVQDIKLAIDKLKLDKSPGPDGLTSEFYKFFSPQLVPLLSLMYTHAYTKGALPQMFSEAYITVLEKNPDDRISVGGYRPISLLNTDYKILTKILVNKLQPYLHTLLHENQFCGIPGRNIETLNHTIRDIIIYTHIKNMQAALLSIDQEKAFDRVDHGYLFKVLRKNNVGSQIEGWVRLLYASPCSRILVNHTLTSPFPIERSVRQGCPLSPLLYALCLEPLLEKVRTDAGITGISMPGGQVLKVQAYADDTTFTVTSEKDIKKILEHFKTFNAASGGKININKSNIMGLGAWKRKEHFPSNIQNKTKIKITGIVWHNNPNTYNTEQYNGLLQTTDNIINMYTHISHTIFGRSAIVNTLIIPKIIYIASVTEPPPHFITNMNKKIRAFLFKSTIRSIHHNTLIQNKRDGGIGLQDIKTKIQALRLKYIGQIVRAPDKLPLAMYFYGLKLSKLIPIQNNTPHYFGNFSSSFYKSVTRILLNNEHLIHSKTKNIYISLITRVQIPLHTRIKWGRQLGITDFHDTFISLHNKHIAPQSKEISYRLLFNMTPTLDRKKQNTRNTPICKMCTSHTQENEEHIYLTCPAIIPTKQTLKLIMDTTTQSNIDIDLAITLFKIPRLRNNTKHTLNLITLAEYKQHIWTTYLKTRFDQKH